MESDDNIKTKIIIKIYQKSTLQLKWFLDDFKSFFKSNYGDGATNNND